MTTREDFEKWFAEKFKDTHPDAFELNSFQMGKANMEYGWQACAAHYEATINTLNDAITEDRVFTQRLADLEAEIERLKAELLESIHQSAEKEWLIAEKDKALNLLLAEIEDGTYCYEDGDGAYLGNAVNPESDSVVNAEHALSLTHDSVRLKEIGQAVRIAMHNHTTMATFDSVEVPVGAKLYTIVKGERDDL